ncbi:hypothetical protein [Rhodopseudomonas palustris]
MTDVAVVTVPAYDAALRAAPRPGHGAESGDILVWLNTIVTFCQEHLHA